MTLLTLTVTAASLNQAQAQSYSKTFSRTQAQDPGISFQLCQNDMAIIKLPGAVKSVGVTLPNNVEPLFDGNRVILRGNVTSGRTPAVILMRDSDDIYRLHISGCPTRGASTLLTIVDDAPAPAAAKEYTVAPVSQPTVTPSSATSAIPSGKAAPANSLNPNAAINANGVITLPTPTTVTMEMTRTSTGVTLNIANGTAQTLALRPENLKVMMGSEALSIPATVNGNIAPGMIGAYPIPVPSNLQAANDVTAMWLVEVPALKANFNVSAALR